MVIPQFEVNTFLSQWFWLSVCFGSLYLLIKTLFVPKLESVLRSRKESLKKENELSEKYLQMAKELELEHSNTLKEMHNKIESMKKDSLQELQEYVQAKATALKEDAMFLKDSLSNELDKVKKELEKNDFIFCTNISNAIIKNITESNSNKEKINQIYKDFDKKYKATI